MTKDKLIFVSYSYIGGFGNGTIKGKIENWKDLKETKRFIEQKEKVEGVMILFWKELKE